MPTYGGLVTRMDLMSLGLQLMIYGLFGVFSVLLVLMAFIKLLTIALPPTDENNI